MDNPEDKLAADDATIIDRSHVKMDPMEVVLVMSNGTIARGFFFVLEGQRVSDVLNDERQFIPFLDNTNSIRLLRKDSIMEVKPWT